MISARTHGVGLPRRGNGDEDGSGNCKRLLRHPHEAADSGLCFWIPYFMMRYIRVFRVMPK